MAEDNQLEELRKRLYKKNESFDSRLRRPELTPSSERAPAFWKPKEELKTPEEKMPKPKKHFFSWKVWTIIAIFVLAVGGFFAFYFITTISAISDRNIGFKINAPSSIEGGEAISWEVLVTNSNKQPLESADIVFEYPEGSIVLDPTVRGLRERKILGKINPDETVKAVFNAFIFGEESEQKIAKATLEYVGSGSNAILFKDAGFETRISRAPIGISFDFPSEVRAGQETEIKINYVSNSVGEAPDLFLEVEYPAGFEFRRGIPAPEGNNRTWRIGSLKTGERGAVIIRGVVNGEEAEEKSFHARIGARSSDGVFSVYGGGVASAVLRSPFLAIDVKVNNSGKYIAKEGEIITAAVSFKNNLPVPVQNASVELFFTGNGLDEKKIRVVGGSYRSSSRSIVWNSSSSDILKQLEPGEEGTLNAQFSFLDPVPIKSSSDKDFKITAEARIMPGITPPGYFGTDLVNKSSAEALLITELQLARRGFYFSNVLPNSGPIPPKVGAETTFTIFLSLTNSTNDLENVIVKTSLPAYVNWKEAVSPSSADVTFDSASGEVIWRVGTLRAGTGFVRPALEAAFQIGLVPGANHIGFSPELVSKITAEGRDAFTDSTVQVQIPELTLDLKDDLRLNNNDKRVIP